MMRPIWLVVLLMTACGMGIGFMLGLIGADKVDPNAPWPTVINSACGLVIFMGFLTVRHYCEGAEMLRQEWNRIHSQNIQL